MDAKGFVEVEAFLIFGVIFGDRAKFFPLARSFSTSAKSFLGLNDAAGFAVKDQQVIGQAGVHFAHGDAELFEQVDTTFVLYRPPGSFEFCIDYLAGFGFEFCRLR